MRILFIAALVLLAGCAGLGRGPRNPFALDARLPSDTLVRVGELPNGITYYVRPNREPNGRAELRLVVNAGSVQEKDDELGYAHFVEHMAFNGTRRFFQHNMVDFLERTGMRFGPDVNAYTSFDETVYMLTLPTDSARFLETGMDILEDWATGITFDTTEVRQEKGVIVEEWRLGRGAGQRLQDRHLGALFGRSRYGTRLPIGTPESIQRARAEDLRAFYRRWYRPELMAVVAVGDFDPARTEAMIVERFGRIPPADTAAPRRLTYGVTPTPGTRYSIAADPEATSSTVTVVHTAPARARRTVREYRESIVDMLYGGVLSDRLNEVTQLPGAPFLDVSSVSGSLVRTLDAYFLTARFPEGGTERALGALLTEAERAARYGFTPAELAREKAELLRSWEQIQREQGMTTSAQFAGQYVGHYLYGGPILTVETEYRLQRALLPEIRSSEVSARARAWLGSRNRSILVSVPERAGATRPDSARLAAVTDSVSRVRLTAYTETLSTAPLLPDPPAGGQVVSERRIEEVGVTEWVLSNGVRVVMKPTEFRQDEIALAGRSPGGTSLVEDADYLHGATAAAAAQVGGVGSFSVVELGKRLAGKTASVGVEIGEHSESVSGYAAPHDVETMFQLVYLYFTAPRRDPVAWAAYRERAREAFRDRALSPEAVFADTLRSAVTQGNPRARPLTAAAVDSLDLDRALSVYRERFGDAGDFTFYMVGAFQPDSMRPLVERYLGGLPATGRREAPRDRGVRTPAGVVRKTVKRGVEPQARTQVVFSGPVVWERRSVALLRTLADALQIRLRERLREQLGGTYGVAVAASAQREPRPEYRFVVDFSAAPDRLDELSAALFTELEAVKRGGVTEADLAKVREQHRRERETQVRENDFWMNQLVQYDHHGWDLAGIIAPPLSQTFTPADLRDAARAYLNVERYVQVSLLPER
ncbi:MAG TPA: insulinase family protein [Longimicrobium sp.]|jgi:zinc protease